MRAGWASASLAGGALATALAAGAHGQPTTASAAANPSVSSNTAAPDDGLRGGGFYLEADRLVQDGVRHLVTAEGSVEARYQGRVLRADELDYNSDTGVVRAHGHVRILNADGTSQFADAITLDKDMSAGVAMGFAARMANHVKLAAAVARRIDPDVIELDRVIYTPCQTCGDGGPAAPTWSIRARRVIQDHRRQTLTFQHAVVQVKGVGVFYLPYIQTADPAAPRKSGLLLPLITFSGARGLSYQQPYYQVIDPSQDLTITPQINTNVNPFINVDYRKRFYSGVLDIRAGYTYDRDFTSGGDKFGPATSRSYILGSGIFRPDQNWTWGFTAEQTSDKLIFDKYSIGNVFTNANLTDRGLYAADDRRLISQLYAVRQDQQSYLSVAAIEVQGLREPNGSIPGDDQSSFPIIAPLVEAMYEPASPVFGGRLRLDASAVVLTRSETPNTQAGPGAPPLAGLDSRRATAGLDWLRTFTLGNGLRVQPFLIGRADLYNVAGLPDVAGMPNSPTGGTLGRAIGWLGANISYPLFKQSGAITYVLEPMAQIAIAPTTHVNPLIPNEDSQDWEFDETNLFEVNRSPGYDLYEGGQSITLGGRASVLLPDGRGASMMVGERLAAQSDPAVPARTGLQQALSDYILAFEAIPVRGITLFARARLDEASFGVNRLEAGANFSLNRVSGYVSYLQEAQSPLGIPLKSLDIHGEAFLTSHWGVTGYAIVDSGSWRRQDVGLVYRDNCVRVEVLYRHDNTQLGTLGPSTSVVLRLMLATFGATGYNRQGAAGFVD